MRLSFRRTLLNLIVLAVLTNIALFLSLFLRHDAPRFLRGLDVLDGYHGDGDSENLWCDWDKNRFPNDVFFSEVFQTTPGTSVAAKRCSKCTAIVLCVFSQPNNLERRKAIRATWANASLVPMENLTLWFVIGESQNVDREIESEAHQYGDILVVNFHDSKESNTLKLLYSYFFAITRCPFVREVYFGYDNTYANVQRLSKQLHGRTNNDEGVWRGQRRFWRQEMVQRRNNEDSLNFSREGNADTFYPLFCSLRNGFTLSASLGKKIIHLARNETISKFVDDFLCDIARKAHIKIVFDDSFGLETFKPNITPCRVRREMTTFTYLNNYESHWKELVNREKMLKCFIPALDVVFRHSANNGPYFRQVLGYINNNESVCRPVDGNASNTFVVALISSHVKNLEQRQAIRETWASQRSFYGRNIRFVFILGKSENSSSEVQEMVDEESEVYGDIVQGDFYESFRNLTLKVVLGLKWATEFCSEAAYFYKGDEDMFIVWERLIRFLLDTSDRYSVEKMSRFFVGMRMYRSRRINNPRSRYYVNQSTYAGDYYPPYCSGGAYVLSMDIIPELYEMSQVTPLIPVDDAYVGILTAEIGVHPTLNRGFHVSSRDLKMCLLQHPNTLTLHGFKTPASMRSVWERYNRNERCIQPHKK